MRTGVCSIQQALTAEAASIVKQAVGLARPRGHSQVTPLHVASAMLASSNSLLKRACLKCHSHPLQCKALELCFNVSLNRLPASNSIPLLSPSHPSSNPSLSNALVAAFKRAQAHQRRGSVENNQQPILALKIEAEQLVLSILDDPSVSRVMREAGFSSTLVKSKVEQSVSMETSQFPKETPNVSLNSMPFEPVVSNNDVMSVLGSLVRKRNTVIVGESLEGLEGLVRGVMSKFEGGEVEGEMRYVQLITLPLFSLRSLSKEEVEGKLVELRCLVKSYMSRGVVLYLGDLKWVSELWPSYGKHKGSYYCPVEHIVMELRRMACGNEAGIRLWLLGVATFDTYLRCRTGHPSLEAILELHSLTVPVGTLSLSLNLNSDWAGEKSLKCFDSEALSLKNGVHNTGTRASSNLPCWLQKYKEERRGITNNDEKWNSICSSSPKHQALLHSPSSPPSISSHEHVLVEPKGSPKEQQFWMFMHETKPELLSNPNSSPNSASSSEVMEDPDDDDDHDDDHDNKFKECSAENLRALCSALEAKVPHQKDAIHETVSTILQCRSGMGKIMNTKSKQRSEHKEETWLMFLGPDESQTKLTIAKEIARVVYGSSSQSNFISISPRTNEEHLTSKRKRDEDDDKGCSCCNFSYLERFGEAVSENPRRVFFIEGLDRIDCQKCRKGIEEGIESGSIALGGSETLVSLKDAIVIFSCESFKVSSYQPRKLQRCGDRDDDDHKEAEEKLDLNLNIAIDDDDHVREEDLVGDNVGILGSVDKVVTFKIQ